MSYHFKHKYTMNSCEMAAHMWSLTCSAYNFRVVILKFELDILDLKIGVLSLALDKP